MSLQINCIINNCHIENYHYICAVFNNDENYTNDMKNIPDIIVADEKLALSKMEKSELKGLYIDAIINFDFYRAEVYGNSFILLAHKNDRRYTPTVYSNIAARISKSLGQTVVFLFDNLFSDARKRLIKQGCYFIVSNKYAALPFLYINEKNSRSKPVTVLPASAQYMLLYHLQVKSLEGLTFKQMEGMLPFKYITLTRAVKILSRLNICEAARKRNSAMTLHFHEQGRRLWEQAVSYLRDPVTRTVYCDAINENGNLFVSSYNALSRYSRLNPDSKTLYAADESKFREIEDGAVNLNGVEGNVEIELWEYPPVSDNGIVDKLSLYLTLRGDNDPRVEGELEQMIEKIW